MLHHDEYLVFADFQAYLEGQDRVDQAYRDLEGWTRKSILNTARTGFFSADRTIQEYAEQIWKTQPVRVG